MCTLYNIGIMFFFFTNNSQNALFHLTYNINVLLLLLSYTYYKYIHT